MLVGGTSDAALRRAARLAERLTHVDAAEIPLTGAVAGVAARLERYADAGADGVTVAIDGDWNRGIDVLAEARAMTLPT